MIPFFGSGLIASYRWTLYKELTHRSKTDPLFQDPVKRVLLTSLILGTTLPLLVTPVDHARIRMNAPQYAKEYSSSLDAVKKIYKIYGFRGLYKALGLTVVRDVYYYLIFFSLFETITKYFDDLNHR